MTKAFKIKDSTLRKKTDLLTKLFFSFVLSDTELDMLTSIILYSNNNSLTITLDIARQMKSEMNVTDTSFSTSLFRLHKKGLFEKDSKTITLHAAFIGVMEMTELKIKFV